MINHRWRRSFLDVRVFRGADLYTDHFLVVGSIRLKLKNAYHNKSSKKRYDVSRLRCKNEKIQKEYKDRLRSCLRTSTCTCLTGDVEKAIGKSGSPSRLGQVWKKDPGSELNYSIQNLKGSGNESKKSTMQ